jgi:elongation factor P
MITTSDFSKGTRILINDEPYQIVDLTVQSPTARGGNTLVKFKARNLLNGRLTNESVKSGTKYEEPDLHFNNVQYLFTDGSDAVFMDQSSYEQFNLPLESLGNGAKYLNDELKIRAMYFNGQPVNIELPTHVELEVESVEPGTRGNTASGSVTTRATMSNGMDCQVPLNIKNGDRVLISTEDDSYYQRA